MLEIIERALARDSESARRLFSLSDELKGAEPQTQEELDRWIENAQKVSAEIERLKNESTQHRLETLDQLKAEEGTALVTATIEFFEAENAYFRLAN